MMNMMLGLPGTGAAAETLMEREKDVAQNNNASKAHVVLFIEFS
jgi:hypothetical protein